MTYVSRGQTKVCGTRALVARVATSPPFVFVLAQYATYSMDVSYSMDASYSLDVSRVPMMGFDK